MDDAERIRRKAVWDGMTNLARQETEQEKADIIKWAIDEEGKAVEKLKAEGRYKGGLDGNYPELDEISKKTQKKMNDLLDRIFKAETASQR